MRGLVAMLLRIYAANTQTLPPGATAVAASALGLWLFVLGAWWVDRRRRVGA